jgi:hypothetical protein
MRAEQLAAQVLKHQLSRIDPSIKRCLVIKREVECPFPGTVRE